MNLLKNGYRVELTASIPMNEETFRWYVDSDYQIYYNKARGAYALGMANSSEAVNEYIGATQEEAGEWLEEFAKEFEE